MKYTLLALTLLFCLPLAAQQNSPASSADSVAAIPADTTHGRTSFFKRLINYFEQANVDKTQYKKFDFSIIGGPSYASATGFGVGLVAAGLYRIDRTDMTLPPSNTSLFSDIASTGFFMIGIRGNTLFKAAKYRMDYTFYFYYRPSNFWGVGYDAGENNPQSTYTRLETQLEWNGMRRVAKNMYVGVGVDFDYTQGKKFTEPGYIPAGQDTEYVTAGGGAFFLYDSRDLINNAFKGFYVKLDQRFYPAFMSSSDYFARTELTADFYHAVWKGAHLAYDLHGQFNYGNPPWTMIAQLGGPYRMRGYYEGRYRDNNILEIQAELRQKIHGRNGVAIWVGAGNVFPSLGKFDWGHTLPNYGLGYRWEFKKRVNVRLDYGIGKGGQSGFIFNINEAF